MTCSVDKTIEALVETSIGSLLLLKMLFPHYDQLTIIYAKDRATRKDAQIAADVIEEVDAEDVATANTHEERNDYHGCKADVSSDEIDLSATQLQPSRNQDDSMFSKKKKKFLMQVNKFLLLHLLMLPHY
ncbi:hypothetical protein Godav_019088 [Gossypium davidsonii]|uniref:Uncharacterized protein n=1 Tax=Gossypium davidsonii TaxID=34287 RepID=A0A7J8QZB1_GOSDV|nr:hypothetical protein [Gossypium davidsonii]